MALGKKYGGRKKGTPNKSTQNVKTAIELAFQGLGGVKGLMKWAKANQTEFYTKVWLKLVPSNVHLSDEDGNPLEIKLVTYANNRPS